jgi:hypothetical protein
VKAEHHTQKDSLHVWKMRNENTGNLKIFESLIAKFLWCLCHKSQLRIHTMVLNQTSDLRYMVEESIELTGSLGTTKNHYITTETVFMIFVVLA